MTERENGKVKRKYALSGIQKYFEYTYIYIYIKDLIYRYEKRMFIDDQM